MSSPAVPSTPAVPPNPVVDNPSPPVVNGPFPATWQPATRFPEDDPNLLFLYPAKEVPRTRLSVGAQIALGASLGTLGLVGVCGASSREGVISVPTC
jgi:hypothetical protein